MSSKYFLDVGCGFIPGRSIVNIFGTAFDVHSSETPCTIWPQKTLYEFPNAGENWQIRSTSPLDTLLGIGAQKVAIDILDTSYNKTPLVVNLNGLFPVALPTGNNNFRCNGMTVVQANPAGTRSNVGDLILEPLGGGLIRAFILAGKGFNTSFTYTVPAGHNLWLPNFLFNMAKLGGGNVVWKEEFRILLPNGTSIATSTTSINQGAVVVPVLVGFTILEKVTIEVRVNEVSANGGDIIVQATGVLTNLTDPSVIQRRPTAFTEY